MHPPIVVTLGLTGHASPRSTEGFLILIRQAAFGEDASRLRSDHAPQNLAALRNLAITLMNDAGHNHKAAAQRRYQAHPDQALALIRGP